MSTNPQARPLLHNGEALRINVEKPPGGGGDKHEPLTPEQAGALLRPQLAAVRNSFSDLEPIFKVPGQTIVEAKLLPNYLDATSFPSHLLSRLGAVPVGSKASEGDYVTKAGSKRAITRKLVLAMPDTSLAEFESILSGSKESLADRSGRAAFEDIKKISEIALPMDAGDLINESSEDAGEEVLWEVVLNPTGLQGDNLLHADEAIIRQFSSLVRSLNGKIEDEYVRYVAGLTFAPVRATAKSMASIARFNLLRTIRPMPSIPPRPVFGLRSSTTWQGPASSTARDNAFKVAVFDGGLDQLSNTKQHMVANAIDLTSEPANNQFLTHGTAVTGASLYGLIQPGQQASPPPLPVDSFRVLPAPSIPSDLYGYWVLDRILEVVKNDQHKIINLSLGPTLPVQDDSEPNRWTAELDTLAWERDVLFVVAAGNDGHLPSTSGKNRVQVPADMVNGFTVGACDSLVPTTSWKRASYSSIGPGRWGGRVQPLGVQFGGTDLQKFPILAADGSFLEATGTSFAAPLVTHAISELAINLPLVNSNVLRAFGVHFAERPSSRHKQLQPEVGYGRLPSDFLDNLNCTPDETHVLFRDEVDRNELSGYRLPIPQGLTGKVELRLTLSYLSPVEPAEATEYTKASIDLTLRPHQFIHRFTSPHDSSKYKNLDRRSADALALISSGWKDSKEPITRSLPGSSSKNEASLREAGKWETLRHYRMTFDADQLDSPRMELSYLARGHGRLDKSPSKLPFAMLMTIVDLEKSGTIYDSASSQFRVLQPATRIQSQIGLRSGGAELWQS